MTMRRFRIRLSLAVRHFLRWLLAVAIFVFLIGAIFYFGALPQAIAFEPTGDALFDRYARTVRNRYGWRLFYGTRVPAYLPDAVLASWEDEFGNDPRYWELRWYNTLCTLSFGIAGGPYVAGPSDPDSFLVNARECEDAPVSSWILSYVADQSAEYLEQGYKLNKIRKTLPAEEAEKEIAKETAAYNIFRLKRLEEVIAAHPDEAWPYYLKAGVLWEEERKAEAFELLRLGNAAPSNAWPMSPFPMSFVYERLASEQMSGSEAISGAILTGAENPPWPTNLQFKQMFQTARENGDTDHVFRCLNAIKRMAVCDGAPPESNQFALGWFRYLSGWALKEYTNEHESEEVGVLLEARDQATRRMYRGGDTVYDLTQDSLLFSGYGPLTFLMHSEFCAEYARQAKQEYYRWKGSSVLLNELHQMDYEDPVRPESWKK